MSKIFPHIFFTLTVLLASSCKPGTPKDVLSAQELENILYDIHMAQAMAQQHAYDSLAFYSRLYQQAVFKEYGIGQNAFDRTMEWYSGHTKELTKIYDKLAERLGDTSPATAASDGQGATSVFSASGDTASIWHGPSFALLSSQGNNRLVFKEKADSTLQSGDLLKWVFATNWHYHEGERRALAVLAIHYEGDSVAVTQKFVNAAGYQIISTHVADKKVEGIEGFIYQETSWSQRPRILAVSDIQMLRVHICHDEDEEKAGTPSDTIRRQKFTPHQRLLDNLERQDSLNENKPHFR